MQELPNSDRERIRRVLVIDDNRAIPQDIRKILARQDSVLDDIEAALFGGESCTPAQSIFEIDSCLQGEAGVEMVRRAALERRPYGLAFVDLHMPPGWDGLETIARIWQVDPEIQIVLWAALLDCSWDEVVARLGRSEGLAILKKPFEAAEVQQLANTMTDNWRSRRDPQLSLRG
jgi:CheY-like chemotaxis protein